MQVFYIEIDKFLKTHQKDFLIPYADIEIKTQKRFREYAIGRYLVTRIAKEFYKIKDTQIIKNETGKPVFKNANLHFSISHSKNIVIACFDKSPCGIDIEYIKERDLKELSKYFDKNFETTEDFYKFWTTKEATFKSNNAHYFTHSYFDIKNYCLSISSKTPISLKLHSLTD